MPGYEDLERTGRDVRQDGLPGRFKRAMTGAPLSEGKDTAGAPSGCLAVGC